MGDMSYIQDVKAMLRYQGLIEKEKKRNQEHPATRLARKRFFGSYGLENVTADEAAEIVKGPSVGSILSIGLNKDPRKVKFEEKEKFAIGIVEEPKKYHYIPDIIKEADGSVRATRRLSKMSSHNHFCEQKKALVPTPHKRGGGMQSGILPSELPPELEELLYNGTSEEYEGRYAYLKAKRLLMKPSERVREPVTAAQASSWDLEAFSKTREWAPAPTTGNRGVMLRLWAQDAASLEKSTVIHNNNIAMEIVLGLKVRR